MKLFASSDHHFYHKNIIKYAERPFDITDENCVIDNAKLMIENHNAVVKDDDIVLLVGDLSCGLKGREEHFQGLLKLLNGKKILIRGNHDYQPKEFYLDAGFVDVVDYIEVGKYFISHYPCYESKWNRAQEKSQLNVINRETCEFVIHGHIHNKDPNSWEPDGITRINVCVDFEPNNFTPIELKDEELINYFIKYTK